MKKIFTKKVKTLAIVSFMSISLLFMQSCEKQFVEENDIESERKNFLNRQFVKHKNLNLWEQFFYHLFFRLTICKKYYILILEMSERNGLAATASSLIAI